jgi:RNA polymerase sigma-70 factor (ECF subfamily)
LNSKQTDQQLAEQIGHGSRDALALAYERESRRVYQYVLAMTHNSELAADVLQDTFLSFAAKPQGYDASRGPLQGYLLGIARHQVMAAWTREGRHTSLDASADNGDAAMHMADEVQDDTDPGEILVQRQSGDALMAAIAKLPPPFREALILVELQERSYVEAAQIAGIELNTLRTRLHRAKHKLAQMLRPATTAGAREAQATLQQME